MSFSIEALTRGYNVYKDIWSALICFNKTAMSAWTGNHLDQIAVAVYTVQCATHKLHYIYLRTIIYQQ